MTDASLSPTFGEAPPAPAATTALPALRAELVGLISEVMRRDPSEAVDPGTITDATPCLGAPLLLDSLDVLELVVSLDRAYGVSLRDADVGRAALATMGSLTKFVSEHRTR